MHTLDALLTRLIAMAHRSPRGVRLFLLLALALGMGSAMQSLAAQEVSDKVVAYAIDIEGHDPRRICLGETVFIKVRVVRVITTFVGVIAVQRNGSSSISAEVSDTSIVRQGLGIPAENELTTDIPFSQEFSFTGERIGETVITFDGLVRVNVQETTATGTESYSVSVNVSETLNVNVDACAMRVNLTSRWTVPFNGGSIQFRATIVRGLLIADPQGSFEGTTVAQVVYHATLPTCGTRTITIPMNVEMSAYLRTDYPQSMFRVRLVFDGSRRQFDITSATCSNYFDGLANAFIFPLDLEVPAEGGTALEAVPGGSRTPIPLLGHPLTLGSSFSADSSNITIYPVRVGIAP